MTSGNHEEHEGHEEEKKKLENEKQKLLSKRSEKNIREKQIGSRTKWALNRKKNNANYMTSLSYSPSPFLIVFFVSFVV